MINQARQIVYNHEAHAHRGVTIGASLGATHVAEAQEPHCTVVKKITLSPNENGKEFKRGVSAAIGSGGDMIKRIQNISKCRIQFRACEQQSEDQTHLIIKGDKPEQVLFLGYSCIS